MIVFTDLDGSLLDRETYSFAPALPALSELRARGIPVVLVTSKTRSEVEALRREMGNQDPFIVENGGALVFSDGSREEFGSRAVDARRALAEAAVEAGVPVRGFSSMTPAEISSRSGLPAEAAALAALREYGEPFVLLEPAGAETLFQAIGARGFSVTQGGRFFHITRGCDKSRAVIRLSQIRNDPDTVGLGDAPNDIGFLQAVRTPIIIPSPHLESIRAALPGARIAPAPGPGGWNDAVLALLSERS